MPRESSLDNQIEALCAKRGAEGTKIHGGDFQSGIADWLICYKGRFIAVESKAVDGKIRPAQRKFLRRVRCTGGIGEFIYNVKLLEAIFDTIDNGEQWTHGEL